MPYMVTFIIIDGDEDEDEDEDEDVFKNVGQAMPYMVTLIIIEALVNWLGRGQRSVAAKTNFTKLM